MITDLLMCLFCFRENEKNLFSGIVIQESLLVPNLTSVAPPISKFLGGNAMNLKETVPPGVLESAWNGLSNLRGQVPLWVIGILALAGFHSHSPSGGSGRPDTLSSFLGTGCDL